MHIRQTDILTDVSENSEKELQNSGAESGLRWLVMQSLKERKWILAVMCRDFSEYEVTGFMSDNPCIVIQYADYLNKGTCGTEMDSACREKLERLKKEYETKWSCG